MIAAKPLNRIHHFNFMLSKIYSVYSLLLAVAILLLGSGLLGTTLGIRAGMEGFSDAVTGIIMAAFFLGYVLGSYWCPHLIRQVGHIRAFAVFAAIGGVSSIVHGLIVAPMVWWLLRVVTGICMVGLYLVIESWLNSLLDRQHRGKIFAVYVSVTLLSLGASQYLILIYGAGELATLALGAIFFSLALVPIAVTRLTQPAHVPAPKLIIGRLFSISPLGAAASLATGLGNGAFWGLGALYAHNLGFPDADIALFMSAVVFGGALLQVPIGHQSDRHDRRTVLMIVSLFSVLAAVSIFVFSLQSKAGLMISALFYGGFSFAVYSLGVAHTNDHIEADEVMDATRGLLLLNGVGAAIGPIVGGLLMQYYGTQYLILYFAAVFGSLGVFAVYRMFFGVSIPIEEQGEFVPLSRTAQAAVEMDPRVTADIQPDTKPT